MSIEAFTKSTTQKCSALIKDLELFNGNHAKWKWFKQAVNNKLHCNTDHYFNHDDKIDYIDSYLGDKVDCILNHKQNSNDHLDFEIYLDLLSFFDKYYQNHLQGETDMKEWKALCIKYDDQFSVFWIKFTTLVCKVGVLFNNMLEQSVNLLVCQLWRKLLSWLTEAHLIVNHNSQNLNQLSQFYEWLNWSYHDVAFNITWCERHCQQINQKAFTPPAASPHIARSLEPIWHAAVPTCSDGCWRCGEPDHFDKDCTKP